MNEKMLAVWYERTGTATDVLQMGEVSRPMAGPGEVRVRLAFSGINPTDVKSRAGRRGMPPFDRVIPHHDGAGIIDQVGAGVPDSRLGERVWVFAAAYERSSGTAAEFVTLPSAHAVALPSAASMEVGACLGVPALTAWRAVSSGQGIKGDCVLVAGGAGAVGLYAIQMAKALGAARVLATVGNAKNAAVAQDAGADVVIDYRRADVVADVMRHTSGEGVDCVIELDAAANMETDLHVLKKRGRIVVYGSSNLRFEVLFYQAIRQDVSIDIFSVFNLTGEKLKAGEEFITRLLIEDGLKHRIGQRFPLEHCAQAHELVESGHANGKVLLQMPNP